MQQNQLWQIIRREPDYGDRPRTQFTSLVTSANRYMGGSENFEQIEAHLAAWPAENSIKPKIQIITSGEAPEAPEPVAANTVTGALDVSVSASTADDNLLHFFNDVENPQLVLWDFVD